MAKLEVAPGRRGRQNFELLIYFTIFGVAYLSVLGVIGLFLFTTYAKGEALARMHQWAEIIATIAIVGALIVAYFHARQTQVIRYLEVTDRMYLEFAASRSIQDRRWIICDLPMVTGWAFGTVECKFDGVDVKKEMEAEWARAAAQLLTQLSRTDKDRIKRVLNSMDRASLLCRDDNIPSAYILPWLSPMVYKVWQKVVPLVAYVRLTRNGENDFYDGAEALALACKNAREESPGTDPKKIKPTGPTIDADGNIEPGAPPRYPTL